MDSVNFILILIACLIAIIFILDINRYSDSQRNGSSPPSGTDCSLERVLLKKATNDNLLETNKVSILTNQNAINQAMLSASNTFSIGEKANISSLIANLNNEKQLLSQKQSALETANQEIAKDLQASKQANSTIGSLTSQLKTANQEIAKDLEASKQANSTIGSLTSQLKTANSNIQVTSFDISELIVANNIMSVVITSPIPTITSCKNAYITITDAGTAGEPIRTSILTQLNGSLYPLMTVSPDAKTLGFSLPPTGTGLNGTYQLTTVKGTVKFYDCYKTCPQNIIALSKELNSCNAIKCPIVKPVPSVRLPYGPIPEAKAFSLSCPTGQTVNIQTMLYGVAEENPNGCKTDDITSLLALGIDQNPMNLMGGIAVASGARDPCVGSSKSVYGTYNCV
jgi:hypothetical protein